jgi:hypothetical protein
VDVPFIYHDPNARVFALVIPERARAREMSERVKLLEELMRAKEEDVPAYVRNFVVLYGHQGLARHVADARTMDVELNELEPIDSPVVPAALYPGMAGLIPDARALRSAASELTPLMEGGHLWLFVRLGEDEPEAFAESSSDLLIQLKVVEHVPVCSLALVDHRVGSVRRAYLNPARSIDGPIVDLLRREFRATVVVLDAEDRLLRSFEQQAPRAGNAAMILERVEHAPRSSRAAWEEAVEACRQAPPPAFGGEHPFVMQDEASNAGEALGRLRALADWSSPGRVDEALLILSVPKAMYELARRRVASDAIRFGLGMPSSLLLQAVQFGLAPDSKSLVKELCERFAQIVPSASEHGLTPLDVQANHAALRSLLDLHGTSTGRRVSCTMEHSG